nr:hypothetical protein [Tanacetum cinerariifolium]
MMSQRREQEQATQREQELLAQKQATQEKKPPQNSDFRQLIEEMCGIIASAEQKQKLEEMMSELLELCREKEFYFVHDSIEDLIGMAMNTMLLSINLKSQSLDKEKQEVKNIVEQATKRKTRITESLQGFKIIHKMSSISNMPQISSVISITPDLPTEEPEYSLSMGDEHRNTIPKMESDEVIKSSVKNLVPIPSESKVTFDNESECDEPVNDESSPFFTTFLNPLFDCNDDFTSSDDKLLSNEDEFSGELAHIDPIPPRIEEADFDLEEEIRLVENFSYDNSSPRPPEEFNAKIADTVLESLSISYPLFDTLLPFSSKNEEKVFKPGILSYLLVSHRDKITSDFSENVMMMYGGYIPLLDVLIAPDLDASRARGIVHCPLEIQSLAYRNPIS